MDRAIATRPPRSPVRRALAGVSSGVEFLRTHVFWLVGLAVAYILGGQIVSPNKRGIKGLLGVGLVTLLLLAPPAFGLSFFIIMFPFPAYTSFGSTNTMIVFLITMFWFLRISTGELRVRGKTMLDGLLVATVITLVVSQYNAPNVQWFREGMLNMFFYISAYMVMYLTYNLVNDERDLDRVTFALTIMGLLVFVTVIVEVFFPYATIIPGWIGVRYTYGAGSVRRMAGVVGGHDSLADMCAILFPLLLFRLYRATTVTRRVLYTAILILDIFALVSTANRGGLIGLAIAIGYLLWLTRREFKIVRYTFVFLALFTILPIFDFYLSTYRDGDSILNRMAATEVGTNLVPDTRTEVWALGWAAFKEHIFVGHGLYFDYRVIAQPHNGYLWSLITVGILGTIPFVLILIKLLWESGKRMRGNLERGGFASGLLTVLHVQIATFVVVQLRTDYQRSPSYVYMMWVIFGLTLVCMRLVDEERRRKRAAA
ncbi:MAG: O-antigen ligase family protein [bacterium]